MSINKSLFISFVLGGALGFGIKSLAGCPEVPANNGSQKITLNSDSVSTGTPEPCNNNQTITRQAKTNQVQSGDTSNSWFDSDEIALDNDSVSIHNDYEDLKSKIDILPETLIKGALDKLLRDNVLEDVSDYRSFSKDLLEAALDDSVEVENSSSDVTFSFSTSPIYGVRPIENSTIFSNDTVFAHFDVSGQALGKVLFKWIHVPNGQILRFKNYDFPDLERTNFVSYRSPSNWLTGEYRVSIYSMGDSMDLVATDSFSLLNIQAASNNEGEDPVEQELLQSGRAFPKKPR